MQSASEGFSESSSFGFLIVTVGRRADRCYREGQDPKARATAIKRFEERKAAAQEPSAAADALAEVGDRQLGLFGEITHYSLRVSPDTFEVSYTAAASAVTV